MFRNLKTKQATTAFLERTQLMHLSRNDVNFICFFLRHWTIMQRLCMWLSVSLELRKSMCEIEKFWQTQITYDLHSNMRIAAYFFLSTIIINLVVSPRKVLKPVQIGRERKKNISIMFSNFFYRCIKSDVCFAFFPSCCSLSLRLFPSLFAPIFRKEHKNMYVRLRMSWTHFLERMLNKKPCMRGALVDKVSS